MSIEYLNAVFKSSLPPIPKLLALAIADYAGEEGMAYPSLTTIMKKTSLSRDAVSRNLKVLIEKEILNKIENNNIPHKYRKKANQNCYQLNISKIKELVAENDQYGRMTSTPDVPVLVRENDQCLVRENDSNHHIYPSVKPSIKKNTTSKEVVEENGFSSSPVKKKESSKKETNPQWLARVQAFELTPQLLEWGANQNISREEMQAHYDFYVDYLANIEASKRKKDLAAQFRNCVRANWANFKKQAKSWQQQNNEATEKARDNFIKMVEEGKHGSAEIDYFS